MRRSTDFPSRHELSWIPLIVIPVMVWINAAPIVDKDSRLAAVRDLRGSADAINRSQLKLSVAAPIQGVTGDGSYFVWERNPKYPVIEFVMILTDERR